MTADPDGLLAPFLAAHDLAGAVLSSVGAGRNNSVWRVEGPDRPLLLKAYRRRSSDRRDRLSVEYAFLEVLRDAGVSGVPVPVARSDGDGLALYTFLDGVPVSEVVEDHVDQCIRFAVDVASCSGLASERGLADASDAYFDLDGHLDALRARLDRLGGAAADDDRGSRLRRLLEERLAPCLKRLEGPLRSAVESSPGTWLVDRVRRILSPSDFGFHNVLEVDGRLRFVDFEYAGWDDPAKLACDFACQPDRPVPADLAGRFRQGLSDGLGDESLVARAEALLPLFRLRWCGIMLNGFTASSGEAGREADPMLATALDGQFDRVVAYFDEHLAGIR